MLFIKQHFKGDPHLSWQYFTGFDDNAFGKIKLKQLFNIEIIISFIIRTLDQQTLIIRNYDSMRIKSRGQSEILF